MTVYGESGRPNYADTSFTPTTQQLLDFGFKTYDLRNFERWCARGQIRYSRDKDEFTVKDCFATPFRKIDVPTFEDFKAHIWAMDEAEI